MGYKTKADEEKEKALWDEGFPKSVYHKDFDPNGDEKNLLKNHKTIYTEAVLKRLGPDWGPHPSLGDEKSVAKVEATEEKPKTVIRSKVKSE